MHNTVYFEPHALQRLVALFDQLGVERVFAVIDDTAYQGSGAAEQLSELRARSRWHVFSDFRSNPDVEEVERGATQLLQVRPDVVIGLGGGTAIDLAKAIAGSSKFSGNVRKVLSGEIPIGERDPLLIAIPTTAGTGSEATHFAVVYADGKKYSLAHPSLLPDYAIIDPCLTYGLPKAVTVASGLDALCQSVESFWAVGATDESVDLAEQALTLALQNLPIVVHTPTQNARKNMCQAAWLSGRAIDIGKTTAPHAISYAITIRHSIPHGIAVALTLSLMLRYNFEISDHDCVDSRGNQHVRQRLQRLLAVLGTDDVDVGCRRLEGLVRDVGGATRFADLGIDQAESIFKLADCVNVERLSNNPRSIRPDCLRSLLMSLRN